MAEKIKLHEELLSKESSLLMKGKYFPLSSEKVVICAQST